MTHSNRVVPYDWKGLFSRRAQCDCRQSPDYSGIIPEHIALCSPTNWTQSDDAFDRMGNPADSCANNSFVPIEEVANNIFHSQDNGDLSERAWPQTSGLGSQEHASSDEDGVHQAFLENMQELAAKFGWDRLGFSQNPEPADADDPGQACPVHAQESELDFLGQEFESMPFKASMSPERQIPGFQTKKMGKPDPKRGQENRNRQDTWKKPPRTTIRK